MDDALREAIAAAGGLRALARMLNMAHQALSTWRRVPPLRVLEVERLTGIPRTRLRPDVYPPELYPPDKFTKVVKRHRLRKKKVALE